MPGRMSELRVIHLLEDLCKGLGHKYQQVPDPAGGADAQRWARSGEQDRAGV